MNICTHEELATVVTAGYFYPQNLSPQKFNTRNILATKIPNFMVLEMDIPL